MHCARAAAWLLVGSLGLLPFPVEAAQTTRYIMLLQGDVKGGEEVVEERDDGTVHVRHVFKDNGRGPELDEEFRLAKDGTFTEYQVRGTSTYGAAVDEHFTRSGDRTEWKSTSESGNKTVSGTGLYVPLNGTGQPTSIAIAALALRPDGKLPLLPSGTLAQRTLAEVDVSRDGETRRVRLLALTGQGLSPTFVWATSGERPRAFATIEPGYLLTIEDGWEANGKMLEEMQVSAESKLLESMAARLMQPLPGLTVIRNARVFDSEHATLGAAADVYVLRGRIAALMPAGTPMRGVDREIDAAGRVLLPGLFDMHGHVTRWEGGLNLAAGVTTVRDMGNANATIQQMIDEISAGRLLSPQLVPTGFLEGQSEFSSRADFVIKTLPEARDAIDWYAQRGYPQLKIYNSFPHALLRETVAYAHRRGMRVSGHVPAFMRAEQVVEQGYDEIQHINQVLLGFFVTPTTDTRTLERFYLPAEKTGDLDLDSRRVQDFIALLKKQPTVIDATLTTFDFLRQRDGDLSQAFGAIAGHMPLDLQRRFRVGTVKIPDDATAARYEKSYAKMIEFVGRLYRAGIPLVAGTDDLAGFTLQRELELYVQAGMTPSQVLQIATWNGARYSRVLADRGSITVGKLADLALIDGDPTRDITDLRKVALVITQGKLVLPSDVYKELGIRPFVDQAPQLREPAKP